ncbi:MAG: hypothetical protein ACK46Q_10810 [Hyphomonas sp.]
MIRILAAAAVSALVISACATAPETEIYTPPVVTEVPSSYELGLKSAGELVDSGNVPAAIRRLMQLVGDPDLTADQKAEVLFELGTLSKGPGGYDLPGSANYFDEIIQDYPGTAWARRASEQLTPVQIEIETLNAVTANPDATRTERFDALMKLGRHEDAIDVMTSHALQPGNEPLLAMYQIGYLCDEPGLTGQSYNVTDRDGTVRTVRFCEYGK